MHVPPDYAAEMAPYLAMVGEFRVLCGLLRSGFGRTAAGGAGARGVLEVRFHEAPLRSMTGRPSAGWFYERMAERPDIPLWPRDGLELSGPGLKLSSISCSA